ncbi:hypothetical protein GCM10009608_33020 [Pseudonocardia alaniniphila]
MPDIDQLAVNAGKHIDNRHGSAASGFSHEAREAVRDLTVALAGDVGQLLAERAVTRWIITRVGVNECVSAARADGLRNDASLRRQRQACALDRAEGGVSGPEW